MQPRAPAVNEDLRPLSADRMPTLTEVLELEEHLEAVSQAELSHDSEQFPPAATLPTPATGPAFDTQGLVNEVLTELQPRIDMLFESRLREALAPALSRAAEVLIRESRGELGSALHELVEDAVKRALQRRGGSRW